MVMQGRLESATFKKGLLGTSSARRSRLAQEAAIDRAVQTEVLPAGATKLVLWSLGKLKAANRRVRKTSPIQLERVIRSVRRYGVVAPVLVDEAGVIINGHIVVEAAQKLGLSTVPVFQISHLTEAEVRGLRIALNRLGETGEWDLPELAMEIGELSALDFALVDTGLTLPEIDILTLGGGERDNDRKADALPAPSDTVVSEVGDVWLLGRHRIICGDATAAETYAALLAGEKVDAVFGDPPYNIPIAGFVSGLGATKHDDFVQGVGEWSPDQFCDFLTEYLARCHEVCAPGAAIFACMDWRSAHLLTAAGERAALKHLNTIVWSKGSGGMGGLYRSAHEMILLFCNGKSVATNNVALGRHGRDRCNVWNYPGANRRGTSAAKALKLHATPKPVALVEDAICDVTSAGAIVLDPFLGSGTTLIAAHGVGRLGRGIELDPKFVDVSVRRFTEATGIVATHAVTGASFEEMARLRAV